MGSHWLIEEGIGETRAVCIEGGEVVRARLSWPGEFRAGAPSMAQLVCKLLGKKTHTFI